MHVKENTGIGGTVVGLLHDGVQVGLVVAQQDGHEPQERFLDQQLHLHLSTDIEALKTNKQKNKNPDQTLMKLKVQKYTKTVHGNSGIWCPNTEVSRQTCLLGRPQQKEKVTFHLKDKLLILGLCLSNFDWRH